MSVADKLQDIAERHGVTIPPALLLDLIGLVYAERINAIHQVSEALRVVRQDAVDELRGERSK
jgi:hypothetical protein